MKKLYRSRDNSMLGGVCGGFGEYFDIDPTIIRLVFLLLVLAAGSGILVYIIAWIVVPLRPESESPGEIATDESGQPLERGDVNKYLPGLILIILGFVFLLSQIWNWFSFAYIWPIIIIAIGVFLIYRAMNSSAEDDSERRQI
ncbi:MAG: PspC domain-containing protein [candidate division Zixibacteria bacterium]|jgi:phage shock protein PspC (stress-responsive transcriptional regulator)|nr:PspC domain-containing protein [candidate division Zixibacteria bacterium]